MDNNKSIYERHISKINNFSAHCASKYKISLLEILILIAYPVILLLGRILRWATDFLVHLSNFLFSFNSSSDSSVIRLHGIAAADGNYYSSKHNLINQYFVKKGWSWTVFASILIIVRKIIIDYRNYSLNRNSVTSKKLITNNIILVAKLLAATSWWWFFTQWFFGLPIMDRVFLATGGLCSPDSDSLNKSYSKIIRYISSNKRIQALLHKFELDSGAFLAPGPFIPESIPLEFFSSTDKSRNNEKLNIIEDVFSKAFAKTVSSSVCRRIGGAWVGGHDPSGHSFILTHSSLFLLFELIPMVPIFINDLYLTNSLFRKSLDKIFQDPELARRICMVEQADLDTSKKSSLYGKYETGHAWWKELFSLLFNPLLFTSFILLLWAWMLFITGIYFHSFPELLGGIIVGYLEVVLVYITPRFLQ